MKRGSYRENDYSFGQTMLTLRSAIGMTQAGLAELLGLSRQSVAEWEAGSKYPKAEHLQAFVALALQREAFPNGGEADAIRELWKASRQKVLLDEGWLAQLLALQPAGADAASAIGARFHWQDALAVDTFYGRERELTLLTEWIVKERCRVVTLLGFGGIGKSTLAVHLMHQVAANFEVVIWRSLRDLPTCDELLITLLQALVPQALGESTGSFEQRLNLLMEQLRAARVLVVLDNVESVLEEDDSTGPMRAGYEDFGRFLAQLATTRHQSTILLTSRQKPDALLPHEGTTAPVRTLRLSALDKEACDKLLVEKAVVGNSSERLRLIQRYAGNPLALKIVAQTIVDLFGGELTPFLEQGGVILGGVRELLDEQYKRLSVEEKRIAFWLAILREPVTLNQLQSRLVTPLPPAGALDTLNRLYRHSLIERGQAAGTFTLQSVVLEYLTEQLVTESCNEILAGELALLIQHGLEQAQVKDYVRQRQTRLLIAPLLLRLQTMGQEEIEARLHVLLDKLRQSPANSQGYGPANLIALLRELHGHLRALDLSHLLLRCVYLQGVEMQGARLSEAVIHGCVFTESFGIVQAVTSTLSGSYWAASTINGSMHVWHNHGRIHAHNLGQTTHLSIPAHTKSVMALAFSPDESILASGSWDCTIKLWNLQSGALITVFEGHSDYVQDIAFSPDGRQLASGSDDQMLRIWDVASGACLKTIHAHTDNTYGVAWSPDGKWLVTCGFDCMMRLWNLASGLCEKTFVGHTHPLTKVAFSPDGRMLASGSFDHTVRIWEVASEKCVQLLRGHSSTVVDIAWSPDGRTIASSSFDGTIRLWEPNLSTPQNNTSQNSISQRVLVGHGSSVYSVAFTADGAMLLSGSDDQTMRLWDVTTGWCARMLEGYGLFFFGVVWSPDGRYLLSANSTATLSIWNVADGVVLSTLRGHTHSVYAAAWSPDGKWLASAGFDQNMRIWDAETFLCVRIIQAHSDLIYKLTWSADGRWLASTGRDQTVRIWDSGTGNCRWIAQGHTGTINEVVWSPDGERLATCSEDRTVRLWRAEDGTLIQTLVGHQTAVAGVAWSPDGRRLASCGGGGSVGEVFVWDVELGEFERGELLYTIAGIPSVVFRVAWSKDSKVLLGAGISGTIHWWDLASGAELHRRPSHLGWVRSLSISPDGSMLVSSGEDGVIHLWDAKRAELIRTLHIDRPYERMDITGIRGVTDAQRATLLALGAIEKGVA